MLQLQFFIIPGAVILLVSLGFMMRKFTKVRDSDGDISAAGFIAVMAYLLSGIAVIILLISLIPFQPKYWFIYSESGTIEQISSRSIAEEHNLTQQFAVKLDSVDDIIVSDDPRLLQAKAGDKLELICSWSWVPYGKDVYNCSLGG